MIRGINYKGDKVTQFNMFERRFADKLTYLDWKLGFMADERDFEFINSSLKSKSSDEETPNKEKKNEIDTKKEESSKK